MSTGISDVPMADRLRRAATIPGVAADALIDDLVDVTGGLTSVVAWTDLNVETFGAEAGLPEDAWLARRSAKLTTGIGPSKALSRTAMARRGRLRAGFGIGAQQRDGRGLAGWYATLASTGAASLDEDLAAAGAIALSPAACESLAGRIRALSDEDAGPRPRVLRALVYGVDALGHHTTIELGTTATVALPGRVAEIAPALELPRAALAALDTAHALLRHDLPVWVRIAALPERALPGLTVVYGPQAPEIALRLVGKLARRPEAIVQLGAFVDALGAKLVDAVELVLGTTGQPVSARFGVALKA